MLPVVTGEDQIHIEQLEIWARLGVSKAEREKEQRLVANITLWPSFSFGEVKDDIAETVDYSAVRDQVKRFVQNRQDQLLETIGEATTMFLLKTFPVRKVRVELQKFVLPDAAFASVVVTRGAAIH